MNPNTYTPQQQPQQQQQQQYQPQIEQPQPPQTPIVPKKKSTRTKLALWLMIGPTALSVFALLGYALLNFGISSITQSSATECVADTCDLFPPSSPLQTIANVLLFLAGAISFLTWLPGMIMGIVLLATKPKPTVV